MLLSQHDVELLLLGVVVAAELSVLVSVRVYRLVFQPQEIESDVGSSHLLDEITDVRQWPLLLCDLQPRSDKLLQCSIVQILRQRPRKPRVPGTLLILKNRA
jgi:hypothetical protein